MAESDSQGHGPPAGAADPDAEQVLFDGTPTRVCRRRARDGRRVIAKSLRDQADPAGAAASIRHEFDIARRIRSAHVVEVYGVEFEDDQVTLVLEDFGGRSLDQLLQQRRLDTAQALDIAIQAADGLADIHANDVIHKDINPSNIVYNPDSGVAKIIDFGISSYLSREQADLCNPNLLEGTLQYLSPEQTGRMNRALDYRSDFYSLGATVYELMTGKRMFEVEEPIEWLHCHIARQPRPPHRVDPNVPRAVSDIVMKLLAKSADARYRSARGIAADLRRAREHLGAGGPEETFPLGREDLPQRFQIPQRLYGRDADINRLMTIYDRASRGAAELALVSGYSGIGKTCLIKELYRPITERRGFFVSGKFDQLHRNVPFSAPAAALRALVRELLTEPEAALAPWRERLLEALGGNGSLVIDLVPDLALIIGEQPEVPALQRSNAERRFRRTLRNLVGAFCRAEHPLVLFLDDLQWADAATLDLLELLLVDAPLEHLLILGTYRNNEVQPGHPLLLVTARIGEAAPVNEIELPPLASEDLQALLADALHTEAEAVADLAATVAGKTGGNPYFTEEFLKDLYRRDLIRFDANNLGWTWDTEGIAAEQLTDNVVDLMSAKLMRLSETARTTLEVAACIGHRFELNVLAAVCGLPRPILLEALREAMSQNLVAPLGGHLQRRLAVDPAMQGREGLELAFAHDRIQQSAHAMLAAEQSERIHLEIGRLLIERLSAAERDEQLFRITDHLNSARRLIGDPGSRTELRDFNLAAGRRARKSAAYHAAYEYLVAAAELLNDRDWQDERLTALRICGEAADAACVSGRFEHCDELLALALARAETPEQTSALNRVQLASLAGQGLHTRALELGKALMAERGHRFPARPTRLHVAWHLAVMRWRMRGKTLDDLRALPDFSAAEALPMLGIAERLGATAQFAQPELLPLLGCRGVTMALDHGVSENAVQAFGGISVLMSSGLGRAEEGKLYADFAAHLMERYPDSPARGRFALQNAALSLPLLTPLKDTLEPLASAYEICLECADWDGATQAATFRASYALGAGLPLADVIADADQWRTAVAGLNQVEAMHFIDAMHQQMLNLAGHAEDPSHLSGSSYDIDTMLPEHERTRSRRMITAAAARESVLKYLFGEPAAALVMADEIRALVPSFEQIYDGLSVHHNDALIRLAVAAGARGRTRRRLLRQVRASRRLLRHWADRAPFNALAKYQMVEAEWHRLHGREGRAQTLFDRAIAAAREYANVPDEALANRLAGDMHAAGGRATIAEAYLGKARDAYARWGAMALVEFLEARHPNIVHLPVRRHGDRLSTSTSGATLLGAVDLSALMKSLKAIAEERVHSGMVQTIIDTAMAFAGAQHGVLVLRDAGGELRIEAEATVDGGDAQILQSLPIDAGSPVAQTVINYVGRTQQAVVIHNAQQPSDQIPGLGRDPHVAASGVRSILCLPIGAAAAAGDSLIGMLYLENNHATDTFTEARFETLEIICVAAAGRLELSRKAAVDGLTGLFNRDYFQSMLHQELLGSQRRGRDLSVILADIDHFKRFNDSWGHQLGDEVLKAVAKAIRNACRESDVVARYGGEELAVILPDTGADGAAAVAERVRAQVEAVVVPHQEQALRVTLSLGVATMNDAMSHEEALLRSADEALYEAKHAGRNQVQVA